MKVLVAAFMLLHSKTESTDFLEFGRFLSTPSRSRGTIFVLLGVAFAFVFLLIVALVLRSATVGLALVGPVHAGYDEARLIATGLWSADGIFVWMRLLFGIAGPLSLVWFIWKTVEIRSTQSATGILYVQLFLVLAGELLAAYLRVAAGFPL